MYVTPVGSITGNNYNGGIVPPWLRSAEGIVILPIPVPEPVEETQGCEMIGGPVVTDPSTPVIM